MSVTIADHGVPARLPSSRQVPQEAIKEGRVESGPSSRLAPDLAVEDQQSGVARRALRRTRAERAVLTGIFAPREHGPRGEGSPPGPRGAVTRARPRGCG